MSGDADLSGRPTSSLRTNIIRDRQVRALKGAGAEVIGLCVDVSSARQAVTAQTEEPPVTGAVLNINLHVGRSLDLERELLASGTPFLFITGYDPEVIPAEFSGVKRSQNPSSSRRSCANWRRRSKARKSV